MDEESVAILITHALLQYAPVTINRDALICFWCPESHQQLLDDHFIDELIISHPTISRHLIQYIYHGFLVAVFGSSIHQNTMDEVIAATAYSDLVLGAIDEPALLKVFLKFIFYARIDEMSLLDTLT
ncbi:unnamed protein product [Rotaria magnacalcarata]